MRNDPRVSVLILAKAEAAHLPGCLDEQRLGQMEIRADAEEESERRGLELLADIRCERSGNRCEPACTEAAQILIARF